MRLSLATAALGSLLAAQPTPSMTEAEQRWAARAAVDLASVERRADLDELIDVMQQLGCSEDRIEAVRARCERAPDAGRRAAAVERGAAASLANLAKRMAGRLGRTAAADRAGFARALLRIDSDLVLARAALDQRRIGGAWLTREQIEMRARTARVQVALQRARRLDVPLVVEEREHDIIRAVADAPAVVVQCGNLRFVSTWTPHKAARVVREAVRASAVARWLLNGELVAVLELPQHVVHLDTERAFDRADHHLHARGDLTAAQVREARSLSAIPVAKRRELLNYDNTEAAVEAFLLDLLVDREVQPCLHAGLVNWICLAYFGTRIPRFAWDETTERRRRATVAGGGALSEREELLRLAEAGLHGCRAYMAWLARRGEDPPWSRTLVDEVGMIQGEELLKATLVLEYLAQRGPLGEVFGRCRKRHATSPAERIAQITAAVGTPLTELERSWRSWLCGPDPGIVQRLRARPPAPVVRPGALTHLDDLRRRAFRGHGIEFAPLGIEPSLSAGAAAHARYLARHPDQAERWPDAHEEYPDRDGFSAAGAWAGGHSVIAPAVASGAAAVDGWMGTFYHRLPLLDPGLVRVGWALEGSIAVLDAGSLVRPVRGSWTVVWPHDGMRGVPLGFEPELPHPVPGEDQDDWGYPVTLQLGGGPEPDVRMSLHAGDPVAGRAVDCHFSTPSEPTNPELAPDRAWCLIPKAPLRPSQRYTVRATIRTRSAPARQLQWSFTTR